MYTTFAKQKTKQKQKEMKVFFAAVFGAGGEPGGFFRILEIMHRPS